VADAPDYKPMVFTKRRTGSRAVGTTAVLQRVCNESAVVGSELPNLRFDIAEAARILRFSRATLYSRISDGVIRTQKDGRRTYITRAELERYVASCG
jgi:excisionase family DNA binding protein